MSTAMVRRLDGKWKPCDRCGWLSVCAVATGKLLRGPGRARGNYHKKIGLPRIKEFFVCEEFDAI